jgi:RNA polymerase sigma-70 factor (ECF subfamily)
MLLPFSNSTSQFRAKIKEFRTPMVRLAFSWCGDGMLAEDLAQEAIAKALKSHHQLKDIEKFKCWVFTILNNCWREHLRKQKPTIDLDELVIVADNNMELEASTQQTVERVRLAVSRLPLGQRQVVTLVDLLGFSYAEVATTLEIPGGTVMSRLNRARSALRESLLSYHNEVKTQNHLRRVK